MESAIPRVPGDPGHREHRFHRGAFGNSSDWRDDDMKITMIVILFVSLWILLAIWQRQSKRSWLDYIGFGCGKSASAFASIPAGHPPNSPRGGHRNPQGRGHADALVSELQDAGVDDAGLIVGIDFTRSNEWTGKRYFGGRNMHDVTGPSPNPYQEVLNAVGLALGPLNQAGKIWCYGFGDESTRDEGVFCFMPQDQPCRDLDEALDRYESVARRVKLLGPTSFAPLVRKAIEIVKDSGRRYHCLVIIADGQVTNECETVKAIQEASSYPLSIIMVGVGEGPWDTCRVFDNRLPGRRFDNFRFVEHRRVKKGNAQALALSALAEVPDQYRAIRKLGLFEGGTTTSRSEALRRPGDERPTEPTEQAMSRGPPGPSAPPEEDEDEAVGVPNEFVCPLTLEVMIDPVVCEDGHSYERGALEAWLAIKSTSPLSNVKLNSKIIVPNHTLRSSIEAWRAKRGY